MRCETCKGQGSRLIPIKHPLSDAMPGIYVGNAAPCPDCNGSGVAHCCDGLKEQPDGDDGE